MLGLIRKVLTYSKRGAGAFDSLRSSSYVFRSVIILLLVFHVSVFLFHAFHLLAYPYDWEPSESDHIYYTTRILNGDTLYKDDDSFPLICMNYPPGYHLLLALPVKLFGATMFVGRMAALIISGILGILLYKSVTKETGLRFLGIAMAVSLFAYGPVSLWLAIVRVDAAYLALALAGIYFLSHHERGRRYILLASFCIAYSFFTKQQGLFAVGAGTLFLLVKKKYRECVLFLVLFVAFTVPTNLILDYMTQGWYNKHLFGFHLHRELSWARKTYLLLFIFACPIFLAATCYEIVHEWKTRRLTIWNAYFLASLPVALLIFFDGTADNYFLPMFSGLLIMAGLGLRRVAPHLGSNAQSDMNTWVYVLIIFQLVTLTGSSFRLKGPVAEDRAQLDVVARLIRSSDGPVLVDRMNTLIIGTKHEHYFVQPVLLRHLYLGNEWNPDVIISPVSQRTFSVICIFNKTQFVQPVVDSIQKNYTPVLSVPVKTYDLNPDRKFIVLIPKQNLLNVPTRLGGTTAR